MDLIPGEARGTNFYLIGKSSEGSNRCHKNRKSQHCKVSLRHSLNIFKDQIGSKCKDAFLKTWKRLESCKKGYKRK